MQLPIGALLTCRLPPGTTSLTDASVFTAGPTPPSFPRQGLSRGSARAAHLRADHAGPYEELQQHALSFFGQCCRSDQLVAYGQQYFLVLTSA
jgi:hypothetical protein